MRKIFATCCFLLITGLAIAQTPEGFYQNKQYDQARSLFLEALDKEPNNDHLMFNIGNCYLQQNQLGHAIVWYRRSLALAPNDLATLTNLRATEMLCIDKPEQRITSLDYWAQIFRPIVWQSLAIVLFIVLLISLLGYLLYTRRIYRRTAFYIALFVLPIWIVALALSIYSTLLSRSSHIGVVVVPQTTLYPGPKISESNTSTLYDGATFTYVDAEKKSAESLVEIRLSNGQEGWIPSSDTEAIHP